MKHIKRYGETALLLEWEAEIDPKILQNMLDFKKILLESLEGEFEIVSLYWSILLIWDKPNLNINDLKDDIHALYDNSLVNKKSKRVVTTWELPVYYGKEVAWDMESIVSASGLDSKQIIEKHCGATYTVYGIGFLPGFLYLGGLHKKIHKDRLAMPRAKVPKGAVGIAGEQTGIYPQGSPGGWNIIGNCPIPLFDVNRYPPSFVKAGDRIYFKQVRKETFLEWKAMVETPDFNPNILKLI